MHEDHWRFENSITKVSRYYNQGGGGSMILIKSSDTIQGGAIYYYLILKKKNILGINFKWIVCSKNGVVLFIEIQQVN